MRAPVTDKHLLEMMWERFPEIMKRGTEQPAPVRSGRNHYEDGDVFERIAAMKTQPAQRAWVGLTDEQVIKCWGQVEGTRHGYVAFARAIEAKLKEKNT